MTRAGDFDVFISHGWTEVTIAYRCPGDKLGERDTCLGAIQIRTCQRDFS